MERIYCSEADSCVIESTSSLYNTDFSNSATLKNIEYMGCSHIIDPVNEDEIKQIMESFNRERLHDTVSICLQIPPNSSGTVRLFGNICSNDNPDSNDVGEISSFPVNQIRFCARGMPSSLEGSCFALSFTQYSNVIPLARLSKNSLNFADGINEPVTSATATHQCHVFRCTSPDAAGCVLRHFAQAFRNSDFEGIKQCKSTSPVPVSNVLPTDEEFEFETFLEIKESEGSSKGYSVCPLEKNCFKLRRDRDKLVVVVLRQTRGERHLKVKKCFGLLLAAGRNLRDEDMHLLDVITAFEAGNQCHKFNQHNFPAYTVEARWDPSAQNFEVLNTETPKETRVFMTVAIDVILGSIDEPVRFVMECKARVFQQFEMFWQVPRKAVNEKYFLVIKKVDKKGMHVGDGINEGSAALEGQHNALVSEDFFKVMYFKSLTEREKYGVNGLNSPTKLPTQLVHPVDDDESVGILPRKTEFNM